MKNMIKKIAAAAMAFTLLGTGTAVTKTIAPKADNTLVASAASDKYSVANKALELVRKVGETFDGLWGSSGLYKTAEKGGKKVVGIAEKRNNEAKKAFDVLEKYGV